MLAVIYSPERKLTGVDLARVNVFDVAGLDIEEKPIPQSIAVEPVAMIVTDLRHQGPDLVVQILVAHIANVDCTTTDPDLRQSQVVPESGLMVKGIFSYWENFS